MDIAFHIEWWWIPVTIAILAFLLLVFGGVVGGAIAFVLMIVAISITVGHYLPSEKMPASVSQQTEQTPRMGRFVTRMKYGTFQRVERRSDVETLRDREPGWESVLTGPVPVSHFLTMRSIARKYRRTASILARDVRRHIAILASAARNPGRCLGFLAECGFVDDVRTFFADPDKNTLQMIENVQKVMERMMNPEATRNVIEGSERHRWEAASANNDKGWSDGKTSLASSLG